MNALEYVVQGRVSLKHGGVLRVEDGPGVVIYVWKGAVWVTQEQDSRDYYVGAGDCFRVDRKGTTLVSPTSEQALISLTAPRPDDYAQRVVLSGAGSKGPIQVCPTARPNAIARLLAALGVAQAGFQA